MYPLHFSNGSRIILREYDFRVDILDQITICAFSRITVTAQTAILL